MRGLDKFPLGRLSRLYRDGIIGRLAQVDRSIRGSVAHHSSQSKRKLLFELNGAEPVPHRFGGSEDILKKRAVIQIGQRDLAHSPEGVGCKHKRKKSRSKASPWNPPVIHR